MTPSFFKTLGIEPTQDVRAVKRAYAVALKQIDQQTQAEAFGQLRRAYEQALAWCARPVVVDEPEVDSSALADEDVDQEDEEEGADAEPEECSAEQERAYWERKEREEERRNFEQRFRDSREQQAREAVAQPLHEQVAQRAAIEHWAARLRASQGDQQELFDQALSDPRLVSLEALEALEEQILGFIFSGERPYFVLFEAASVRFGWDKTTLRTAQLASEHGGALGQHVGRIKNTLVQTAAWRAQPAMVRAQQLRLLEIVCGNAPTRALAKLHFPSLEELMQEFARWLQLQLPQGCYEQWEAAFKDASNSWVNKLYRHGRFLRKIGQTKLMLGFYVLVIVICGFWFGVFNDKKPSQTNPPGIYTCNETENAKSRHPENPCMSFYVVGTLTPELCQELRGFMQQFDKWAQDPDEAARNNFIDNRRQCIEKGFWGAAEEGDTSAPVVSE